MINILAGVVVLDDLVLHHTHAGLLDRHLGQRNARLVGRHRRFKEDVIHLLLRERRKLALRLAHEGHALLKRFHTVNRSTFLHIVHPPDCSGWLMRLCYFLDDVHYTRFAAVCQTLDDFRFNKLLAFVL